MKHKKIWNRAASIMIAMLIITQLFSSTDTAFAQPASADCVAYFKVRSGDTLGRIASTFDLTLTQLANANSIKSPYTIYVNQSLCIPEGGLISVTASSTPASTASSRKSFTATKSKDVLTIKVQNFPANSGYNIRVKPTTGTNWEKVGTLYVNNKGAGSLTITLLTNSLKNASQLNVCLKDLGNGKLTCVVTTTTKNTSSSPTTAGSSKNFTAAKSKDVLTIKVQNFPANSGYNIRVKPATETNWEKIGTLYVNNKGEGSLTITLSTNLLKNASQLDVCLKNLDNGKLICTVTTKSTSSTSSDTGSRTAFDNLGSPNFQDSFNDAGNWYVYEGKQSLAEVKNGGMHFSIFKPQSSSIWTLTWVEAENFYVEVSAQTPQTCAGKDRYGLMFRAPDTNHGYLYTISCDGHYRLGKWDGVNFEVIKEWHKSDHILKGSGQTNKLGVLANGSQIMLYVNDHHIITLADDTFTNKARFGLVIGSDITENFRIVFDNFKLWRLQ